MNALLSCLIVATLLAGAQAGSGATSPETVRNRSTNTAGPLSRFPTIEIYTAPGCRSCKAADDYLTSNNIPFTRKDVFADESYMEEMTSRYRSSAVPLIVIDNGRKILRGFVVEAFQVAVKEVMAKQR